MIVKGMPHSFWVVTYPGPNSTREDIQFHCSLAQFLLQGAGGLREEQIAAICLDVNDADAIAVELLEAAQAAARAKADAEAAKIASDAEAARTAHAIADKIIEDIDNRAGIGDEWGQIDKQTRATIRQTWVDIICERIVDAREGQ